MMNGYYMVLMMVKNGNIYGESSIKGAAYPKNRWFIVEIHSINLEIDLHNLERGLTRYEVNDCNLSKVN